MEKDTKDLLINALRSASLKWKGRNDALKRARKSVEDGQYKDGSKKFKFFWQCSMCKEWHRDQTSMEVDHIVEIGPFKGDWNDYISRMFCSVDNLQVLCVKCHQAKTTLNARERWVRK